MRSSFSPRRLFVLSASSIRETDVVLPLLVHRLKSDDAEAVGDTASTCAGLRLGTARLLCDLADRAQSAGAPHGGLRKRARRCPVRGESTPSWSNQGRRSETNSCRNATRSDVAKYSFGNTMSHFLQSRFPNDPYSRRIMNQGRLLSFTLRVWHLFLLLCGYVVDVFCFALPHLSRTGVQRMSPRFCAPRSG